MKRCPECRRDYFDDSLLYCLDDGSPLLDGPGGIHLTQAPSRHEPATLMIHETAAPNEAPTRSFTVVPDHTGSVVVLPFANLSADNSAEYFSDGLAEELINVLSRIRGLRVAGRTSSFSFKGKQTSFEEIGRQLNVSTVLEGSVRMAGERVRIAVQLVNVADGFHVWSEKYDRTLDDIFAIQDDIAASVVEEVRSRLVDAEPDPSLSRRVKIEVAEAAKGRAGDPEAHRLMLLGRHLAARKTNDDALRAIEYFEQALAIESDNAMCWVELNNVQTFRASNGFIPYAEGFEQARASLDAALRIDPHLAAAQVRVAKYRHFDGDFRGADEAIRIAIERAPDDPDVLANSSSVINLIGRFGEALELARRAVAMDPLNPSALATVATSAFSAGFLDEAETAIRRSLELTPQAIYKHAQLAQILAAQGRIDEARTEAGAEPGKVWSSWGVALVEAADGQRPDALAALDFLLENYPEDSAFQIGEIYTALGEADLAFKYLDTAITADPGITQVLASRHVKPLHSDPRWAELLSKIGIPEEYWPKV